MTAAKRRLDPRSVSGIGYSRLQLHGTGSGRVEATKTLL